MPVSDTAACAGCRINAYPAAPYPALQLEPLPPPCLQLQTVVDFLGTSRILPGRAFVKALSLEVGAVAYLHCNGPAVFKDATTPHCALPPRLLSEERLDAARELMLRHGELTCSVSVWPCS